MDVYRDDRDGSEDDVYIEEGLVESMSYWRRREAEDEDHGAGTNKTISNERVIEHILPSSAPSFTSNLDVVPAKSVYH